MNDGGGAPQGSAATLTRRQTGTAIVAEHQPNIAQGDDLDDDLDDDPTEGVGNLIEAEYQQRAGTVVRDLWKIDDAAGVAVADYDQPLRDAARRSIGAKAMDIYLRGVAIEVANAISAAGTEADLDAQYLSLDELDNLPTPEPLIDGILTRGAFAILRGRDGTHKTFIALDWALCLATGKAWQGNASRLTRVLYIAGEGAPGIAKRVRAWKTAWQTNPEGFWFTLRRSSVNLYRGGAPLEHLIEHVRDGGYGLVVIDTLRTASGGADGNSSDMGTVVDNLIRIRDATSGGAVLVLAHTGKSDEDTRGFSGIEDDSDIVWHAKMADANTIELVNAKMKDAAGGAKFRLSTQVVGDSLVITGGTAFDPDGQADADREFIKHMREMFGSTGASASDFIEASGMPKTTVYRTRVRLEKAGLLKTQKRGNGHVMYLTEAAGIGLATASQTPSDQASE